MFTMDRETPSAGAFEVPESQLTALEALEGAVAELAGVINGAQGRLVDLVARALQEGLWAQPGIHTPTQWLAWQLGSNRATASRIISLARRAGELPATTAALRSGELSMDQAGAIARHVPASHETSAVALAHERDRSSTADACWGATCSTRPGHHPRSHPSAERSAATSPSEAPRTVAGIFGPSSRPTKARRIQTALSAAHDRLLRDAEDVDERRSVSWADALLELSDPHTSGRTRPCVLAHLEADPVDPTLPGVVSLHPASPLPAVLARLLTCDGDIRPVWERAGVAVSMGRRVRIVPDRLRRVIEHRDTTCRVPGCGRKRRLQIHHVRHWRDGGPTDTGNLIALCAYHHRIHHLGRLGIAGDADRPDGVTFTDARGRPLQSCGRPRAPAQLPAASGYHHPTGEPLDGRWLHLSASSN